MFINVDDAMTFSDHPREFLVELVEKLISFREKNCLPPVIFSQLHLEAVFSVMDREEIGAIPLRHYRTGSSGLLLKYVYLHIIII